MKKNSVTDFLLDSRVGRSFLLIGIFQLAVICGSIAVDNFIVIINNSRSIDAMVSAEAQMISFAFMIPLSWMYFPLGLFTILKQYFFQEHQANSFSSNLIFFLPYIIYLTIFISAVLINKRVIFYILYTIFVLILIINIAGCSAMQLPGLPPR